MTTKTIWQQIYIWRVDNEKRSAQDMLAELHESDTMAGGYAFASESDAPTAGDSAALDDAESRCLGRDDIDWTGFR